MISAKTHTHAHLDEPQSAVSCDQPVCKQTDDGKVHLAEEQEQGKDAHDVHVHAVDLNYPQACGVGVLYALCLV